MRIDVIVNTTARQHAEKPELLAQMRRACEGIATVHATSAFAELDAVTAAIAARGSDLVVLTGGDGSFMAGVTALARAFGDDHLPPIGLLPCGTVAIVARNWDMRGDPLVLLGKILEQRDDLTLVTRPTLAVEGTRGGDVERRIGFIFGTGLVARFLEVYYTGGAKGLPGAAKIVGRIFVESFYGGSFARRVLDPLPCTITVEGRPRGPQAWSLVCASVVRDVGLHMRVAYRAGEDLARPHLIASPLSARALGPRAPFVLAGKRIGGEGHVDELARDFTVRFAGANGGPYALDGDLFHADVVRVEAGPSIRVVALR